MKKQIFIGAAFMFLFPLAASADYIGYGEMKIGYTSPYAGGYYADYDLLEYNYKSGAKIDFASNEVFCVEEEDLVSPTNYDFFTSDGLYSDGSMATDTLDIWEDNYKKVTWIANWATTATQYNGEATDADQIKAIGQVAIWKTLGVTAHSGDYGEYETKADGISDLYNDSDDYTNDWLLAVSYGDGTDGQNYLVKAAPVPEPATMLLFGTGLVGIAGIARKRKNK